MKLRRAIPLQTAPAIGRSGTAFAISTTTSTTTTTTTVVRVPARD
jgi:hypothetical protein